MGREQLRRREVSEGKLTFSKPCWLTEQRWPHGISTLSAPTSWFLLYHRLLPRRALFLERGSCLGFPLGVEKVAPYPLSAK